MKLTQHHNNGLLMWSQTPLTLKFSDLFEVKVGCVAKSKKDASIPVSGSNNIQRFVSSKSNEGVYVFYDLENTEWIRKPTGEEFEVFVLTKTRSDKPFFFTKDKYPCDGAVMGLTATDLCKSMFTYKAQVVEFLNSQDWLALGFKSPDGRYQFGQRSLSNVLLKEL